MGEDAALTRQIQQRQPAALDRVVRDVLPSLLRAARTAGLDADRADDVAQATLLVFLRRAHEFDGRARASTWLHGILVHKIAAERRALRREDGRDDIEDVIDARFDAAGAWTRPPCAPVLDVVRDELRRRIADCLEGVPDRQRLAFTLREVEGFDTAELCKILAVSPNNLGVLLYRARHRLRECLESTGVSGSADAVL